MPARRGTSQWSNAVEWSLLFIALLFAIEAADILLGHRLDLFGIRPRNGIGLIGILFSPLLHVNWTHLCANAPPLFVLLILLFWDRKYHPERAVAWIWIASGFGTWLIGRGDAIHIGASSLIYGLVMYMIAASWWMRSWRAGLVAVLVLFFYGGIFQGVLPQQDRVVSWEGHLAGALAGLWTAKRNHA
jgi:membrane associated rhomboid family serine protease